MTRESALFLSDFASDVHQNSAVYLSNKFRNKELSIAEYYQKLFVHIENTNPQLNALTSVERDRALEIAKQYDSRTAQPEEVLFGVPVIIKENIQKKGFQLECASNILKGYKGQFDASVVVALEKAGAIIIATANMDEFAMGSSNEHSVHGPVKNPHDLSLVSGGSSGGSAVASAMGFAPLTLGSDTGGSVREPAAFCGNFGFKPTYGRVSRYGLVAFGSSLDQISPFARTAADIDLILQVIGRQDPFDATTLLGKYESYIGKEKDSFAGKKIGVIRSLLKKGVDENVLNSFSKLESQLTERGATFVDIEMETLSYTLSIYYVLACAEASSNLARFDGIRFGHRAENAEDLFDLYCKSRSEGFGFEVKLRIMLGNFALSAGYYDAFYGRAQALRQMMREEFAKHFENCDFIYMPTAPSSAFKIGENLSDPLKMYLNDVFTIPANLAGIPGISVPAPVPAGALPVGLQFLAAPGKDAQLIAFADALEKHAMVAATPLREKK